MQTHLWPTTQDNKIRGPRVLGTIFARTQETQGEDVEGQEYNKEPHKPIN